MKQEEKFDKEEMKQSGFALGMLLAMVGMIAWVFGVFLKLGEHLLGDDK